MSGASPASAKNIPDNPPDGDRSGRRGRGTGPGRDGGNARDATRWDGTGWDGDPVPSHERDGVARKWKHKRDPDSFQSENGMDPAGRGSKIKLTKLIRIRCENWNENDSIAFWIHFAIFMFWWKSFSRKWEWIHVIPDSFCKMRMKMQNEYGSQLKKGRLRRRSGWRICVGACAKIGIKNDTIITKLNNSDFQNALRAK